MKEGSTMKKEYYITLNGERIPVSEEIYRAYRQPAWREHKRRTVRTDMERSLDWLMEDGFDVTDDTALVDDLVADKLLLDALLAALAELTDDERVLIDALYFHDKSEREISRETGVPRKTLAYRKAKLLDKLRGLIEKT